MDNKQCVRLWENNGEYKPLRRPNTNSKIENKKTTSEENTTDSTESPPPTTEPKDFNDILNTSRLSVDAKEWFPSSYTVVPTPPQSAQSRLQKIRTEKNMPENYDANTSQSFDSMNLDILIQSLIYDPGQFDNLIDNFITILAPHFDDIDITIKTAETIFGYALTEASFRYNAARLCSILDEHCPLFRPRLHSLCDKELASDNHRQGLTLFLAELYMQLHYETVYGGCLLQSIHKLISTRTSDDIKSACQALKLAGYSLESNNKGTLDGIFKELELLKPSLSQSLVNMMESVFTLRKNNWGRNTSATLSGNSSQEQNGVISSSSDEEYILYGPDGQEITLEEQEFLCSNLDDTDYLGDESSDPDELYNPEPEMDKEIREAFREFVKMSKR